MSDLWFSLAIILAFMLAWLFSRTFYLNRIERSSESLVWTIADLIDIGDGMVAFLNENSYNLEATSLAAEWDQVRQEVADAVGLIREERETAFEEFDDEAD